MTVAYAIKEGRDLSELCLNHPLNVLVSGLVDAGRCLVHEQDLRFPQYRPRYAQQLSFARTEVPALLLDLIAQQHLHLRRRQLVPTHQFLALRIRRYAFFRGRGGAVEVG